jgi:hypothetical protein
MRGVCYQLLADPTNASEDHAYALSVSFSIILRNFYSCWARTKKLITRNYEWNTVCLGTVCIYSLLIIKI